VAAPAANPPGWRADLRAFAASFRPDLALRLCGVSDPGERSRHRNDFLQAGTDNPGDYPIERIQAPTLRIYGHLDSVVPVAQGERLTREITGSRLVVMPGHHAFFILDEDAMLARLLPFLRKVAQRY
jgi:pimeloyl-ACP methyl ester carboxylesterase